MPAEEERRLVTGFKVLASSAYVCTYMSRYCHQGRISEDSFERLYIRTKSRKSEGSSLRRIYTGENFASIYFVVVFVVIMLLLTNTWEVS